MRKDDWHYLDDTSRQWAGPLTLEELDERHRAGTISEHTRVINTRMSQQEGPMAQGISYSMIPRLNVEFNPTVEEFYEARSNRSTTVLSGPNNCGKTLLLKKLFSLIGQGGYLISCNRFSHVDTLNTRQIDEHEHRRYYENFMHSFFTDQQNMENNELQLQQILTGLKDAQREKLFGICKDLVGSVFSLKRTDPENTFSPYYVDVGGENLRYSSTGTRLLLTLLGTLLDERFSVLLIDEPEIGFSPRIQRTLAHFLYDPGQRKVFCPHIRQLYIATHSHLFLDRGVFSNNYLVTKKERTISVREVESVGDLHQLQFAMLGNDLESLFLPSAIILAEGGSDVIFLTKIVQLHVPDRKVAIVRAKGDGEVQNKLHVLREAFGDLTTRPYRDRLFVTLDKRHSVKRERIKNLGVQDDNIVVWSKNGIEYLYPQELVAAAFCCDAEQLSSIDLESNPVEFNGIRKSKTVLAEFVADRMTIKHSLNSELEDFVTRVRGACG